MNRTGVEPSATVVPVGRVPGVNAIARGHAEGDASARVFLPDAPDLSTIRARAREVLAAFVPRAGASRPGVPDSYADGSTAVVSTGQQAGLFTGPLLTLVKALAARDLAAALSAAGPKAGALFWCATEDHDLVEITRVALPGRDGPEEAGSGAESGSANRRPVGALEVPTEAGQALEKAAAALERPADDEALDALRRLAVAGTFRGAFEGTLRWLLDDPTFPIADAARAEDKPALVPLAVRLVRERREVRRILEARAAALRGAGHELQVAGDPAGLPLFAIRNGERHLLAETEGGRLLLKGAEEPPIDDADVVARFESGEWLPSFSALTRPLATSSLFPVAASVLGPAEVAYWAQMLPLFEWAGVVRPVVVPRPQVALVEPPIRSALAKLGLEVEDVLAGRDALLAASGSSAAADVLGALDAAKRGALEALETLTPRLSRLDATLARATEQTSANLRFAFEKLAERVTAAAGRADAARAERITRVTNALLPGGRLAERVYTPLVPCLRHGRAALVGAIRERLRWDAFGLTVVDL